MTAASGRKVNVACPFCGARRSSTPAASRTCSSPTRSYGVIAATFAGVADSFRFRRRSRRRACRPRFARSRQPAVDQVIADVAVVLVKTLGPDRFAAYVRSLACYAPKAFGNAEAVEVVRAKVAKRGRGPLYRRVRAAAAAAPIGCGSALSGSASRPTPRDGARGSGPPSWTSFESCVSLHRPRFMHFSMHWKPARPAWRCDLPGDLDSTWFS
jgi:hypothetical protein